MLSLRNATLMAAKAMRILDDVPLSVWDGFTPAERQHRAAEVERAMAKLTLRKTAPGKRDNHKITPV
jgi:hypothetical protein